MDFALTPEQQAFRQEIRDFLAREVTPEAKTEDGWIIGFSREFSRKLGERGWIGLTWPKYYGGQERSYLDRVILTEELLRAGAPVAAHWLGDRQVGPALLAYGSEEQKAEILPRVTKGEIVFCLGMSEPGAGSDLASLRTKAVEEGDHFVITGQKIWTSFAHVADYAYLVARTDPHAPKHKGISEFLVDMKTPGVTVRPLVDITGEHHFNEAFFDNVRIEKKWLIGEKNRGWYQIASQLDYERSGIERLLSNYSLFRDALRYAQEHGLTRDPLVRNQLAQMQIELEMGRFLVYKVAWLLSKGVVPNYEAALAKCFCTEVEQRIAQTVSTLLGDYAVLLPGSPAARLAGRAARQYLYAPAYTIQGGTSNILRNIMAIRGLGLQAG
ncbi:MAG TPA: acyl-CoA dehydrogenase family protein [Methylomirabilota bacterium]|jgi:alkylation response protein AidB-like acyl-CoA dehydrogenase|nr:acyl-CoA dehydrogenase family protein [Methylomirabilota bacterium]